MLNPAEYFNNTRLKEPSGLIDLNDREPWTQLNESAFAFRHSLADHPLFTLERLAQLSERIFERVDIHRYFQGPDLNLPHDQLKRRLRNDILGLETNRLWLSMHYIDEMDPDYQALFEELMADIEEMVGAPIRRRMAWGSMSVFMTSPGLRVPYHFDHETNFLMQIRGEKFARLYPKGLATLSLDEIETFYLKNPFAGRYRKELADAGTLFTLTPGVAVHHPPLAPHLIHNGQDVSISMAIYYVLPEMERLARVHQVNHLMRKMGLQPRPPGESPWVDAAKDRLIRAVSMSHPRTHDEMLYSGILRILAVSRAVGGLTRRVRSGVRHA